MSVKGLPEFTQEQVFRLQPGDLLIFRSAHYLTNTQLEQLHAHIKGLIPDGVRVLVLQPGLDLDPVYRPAQQEGAPE